MVISCSKNSDDSSSIQIALPKTMILSYSTGEMIDYKFTYNNNNQITAIVMERQSDGDINKITWNFSYDENDALIQAVATGTETDALISYAYGDNNIITDVDLVVDGTNYETDVFYHGEATNSYAMNGEFPFMPMGWDFDVQNRLETSLIKSVFYTPTYSEVNKGIFSDVNLHPAMYMWHQLALSLAPWELYFFSGSDMEQLHIGDDTFIYKNKLRNANGNLIAFQMAPQVPFGFIIDYTITYENKTL